MANNQVVANFFGAFIEIHLLSLLAAAVVYRFAGVLAAIATFEVSIHALAALVYLVDARKQLSLWAVEQFTGRTINTVQ